MKRDESPTLTMKQNQVIERGSTIQVKGLVRAPDMVVSWWPGPQGVTTKAQPRKAHSMVLIRGGKPMRVWHMQVRRARAPTIMQHLHSRARCLPGDVFLQAWQLRSVAGDCSAHSSFSLCSIHHNGTGLGNAAHVEDHLPLTRAWPAVTCCALPALPSCSHRHTSTYNSRLSARQ